MPSFGESVRLVWLDGIGAVGVLPCALRWALTNGLWRGRELVIARQLYRIKAAIGFATQVCVRCGSW